MDPCVINHKLLNSYIGELKRNLGLLQKRIQDKSLNTAIGKTLNQLQIISSRQQTHDKTLTITNQHGGMISLNNVIFAVIILVSITNTVLSSTNVRNTVSIDAITKFPNHVKELEITNFERLIGLFSVTYNLHGQCVLNQKKFIDSTTPKNQNDLERNYIANMSEESKKGQLSSMGQSPGYFNFFLTLVNSDLIKNFIFDEIYTEKETNAKINKSLQSNGEIIYRDYMNNILNKEEKYKLENGESMIFFPIVTMSSENDDAHAEVGIIRRVKNKIYTGLMDPNQFPALLYGASMDMDMDMGGFGDYFIRYPKGMFIKGEVEYMKSLAEEIDDGSVLPLHSSYMIDGGIKTMPLYAFLFGYVENRHDNSDMLPILKSDINHFKKIKDKFHELRTDKFSLLHFADSLLLPLLVKGAPQLLMEAKEYTRGLSTGDYPLIDGGKKKLKRQSRRGKKKSKRQSRRGKKKRH